MKVLLVGHGCSPRRGSEPGLTWNWAWHLSEYHRVWCLADPHDRGAVERFLSEHPNPRLNMVWVTPPRHLDPWEEHRGPQWVRLHYLLWRRCALSKARQLHREIGFDLAHHVSWGTLGAPPLVWKLPIPLIWGPVGGGQVAPASFRRYFGATWRWEVFRALRVKAAPYLPPVRRAAQRSAAVLATNTETARRLQAAGARDVILFFDTGVPSGFGSPAPLYRRRADTFDLLWAGGLFPFKGLPLALEALARVRDFPVRLLVAGQGPMQAEWSELARRLQVDDRTQFLGAVDWEKMPALYQQAHAFVFTSLRDSFCSQVVEAMAQSLPILTLNHQGVGDYVPPSAGIKAPVTTPEETVRALAEGIRRLARSPELCNEMGKAAWEYVQGQTWEKRAEWMSRLYEEVAHAQCRFVTAPLPASGE